MRIALLSAEYPPTPGGVGDYTQRLGEALNTRGHELFVLTGHIPRRPIVPELRVIELPITEWNWKSWRAVIDVLRHVRPDLLHIQYQTGAYSMHPAINLLPWRIQRRTIRPRLVVTAHDLLVPYLFPKAGPVRGWVTQRLLDDCDAAVLTNEEDYGRVLGRRQTLPETAQKPLACIPIGSNIFVSPPAGYERDAWRVANGFDPGNILVAFFGLISPSKGLDTLLDALELLPAHFRLLIIGGEASAAEDRAYAAQMRQRIDVQALKGRVTITGHCSEQEVSGHLLAADSVALPFVDGASFRRGSLLAALAHGVPVVTTSRPGQGSTALQVGEFPRLVDGVNALLVPPGSGKAIATALQRLAEDASLRERMSRGGQALAARFDWKLIAEQHEALYQGILL